MFKVASRCRVCRGENLWEFLDLGDQPPSNALLRPAQALEHEPKYPLRVAACTDCDLIQLTHVVAPALLFPADYVYRSSVSAAMTAHFAALAREVADRFVPKNGLVVEIGSNDGTLLRSLLGRDLRVLGVDPARNLALEATASGVPTLPEFFNAAVGEAIRREHGPASAIHANNVMAHVDDVHGVVKGVAALLAEDGVFVVEAPYAVDMLEHSEFDTIYHEHMSYVAVGPFARLFREHGLEVIEVQHQAVHGGTIRVFAAPAGRRPVHPSVGEHLDLEKRIGLSSPETLTSFARRAANLRRTLCALVDDVRATGKRVVGYTAPAKGNVLLNYCRLGPDRIEYLADATPAKQGLLSPGMHIPIVPPDHFRADRADYAILLAWNHRAEILAKESEFRARGGKFIVPLPTFEVV